MTLSKIMDLGLVKDDTKIWVRGYGSFGMVIRACGNWYQDNVLDYMESELESFTWQDDSKVYIDIKEEG